MFARKLTSSLFILLSIWTITSLLYLLIPLESQYHTHFGLTLSWLLIGGYSAGILIINRLMKARMDAGRTSPTFPIRDAYILLGVAAVGLVCHYYDKFHVRGYEFEGCVGMLREQWLAEGARRDGSISSVWSALGHLFPSASFPATYVVLRNFHRLAPTKFCLLLGTTFLVMLIYSIPIGSRSTVMLFGAFIIAVSAMLWSELNLSYRDLLRLGGTVALSVMVPFLLYSSYLFYDRLKCSDSLNNVNAYVNGYYDELLIEESLHRGKRKLPSTVSSALIIKIEDVVSSLKLMTSTKSPNERSSSQGVFDMVSIYASHGIWNFESSIHNDVQDIKYPFRIVYGWLKRIGVNADADETVPARKYGKGSVALPGTFWIGSSSYGLWIGTLSLILLTAGLAFGSSSSIRPLSLIGEIGFTLLQILLILSPIALATNLMLFPFLCLSWIFYLVIRSFWPTPTGSTQRR